MKREEKIILFVILFILIYAAIHYITAKKSIPKTVAKEKGVTISYKDKNVTQDVIVSYIENVINNGSNRLHFQKEGMEGGFVPKDKARDVACYVYELSGKKCKKAYSKDAALYFSSNCAGCHGIDGKGLNGAFPDLTREKLLGLMH